MKYDSKYLKALVYTTGAFLLMLTPVLGQQKINGVNLVSPPSPTSKKDLATVKRIAADWVSIIPYGFMKPNEAWVKFDSNFQWWGETSQGTITLIEQAKALDLKIMLKPHIWVGGQGWGGDFVLEKEEDWLAWEANYAKYIIHFATIAEKHQVPLLCIGTELRQIVRQRPQFWHRLIHEIRDLYSGKLTYAANWDNYENVEFWNELDYIGIDGYFPLSDEKNPALKDLERNWQPWKRQLKEFSECYSTPIIFTEYGYQSCLFNTKTPWASDSSIISEENQETSYLAFYNSFWNEKWFAGGFLWKWHLNHKSLQKKKTTFTPQGKIVEKTILRKYGSKN